MHGDGSCGYGWRDVVDSGIRELEAKLNDPEQDPVHVHWGIEILRAYTRARESTRPRDYDDFIRCFEVLLYAVRNQGVDVESIPLPREEQDVVRRVLGKDAVQDCDIAGCVAGSISEYQGAVGAIHALTNVVGSPYRGAFLLH
jgi:hypothetical protein